MISRLNNPEVQDFIQKHIEENPSDIALKVKNYPHLPIREIASQIASRQRIRKKLPEWYSNPELILPHRENLEQASSQKLAEFKAELVSGNSFLDLTGGTGVDSFYLGRKFNQCVYVEPNKELCALAEHNFEVLGADIKVTQNSAEDYLKDLPARFDVIYLDPSRRTGDKKRVFGLGQYSPNVLELMENLQKTGKTILIKTSPMIDIKAVMSELKACTHTYVVASDNEVKEMLFKLDFDSTQEVEIETVNLLKTGKRQSFSFNSQEEFEAHVEFSEPQKFIYDANSAIRKAGAFKLVSNRYDLSKVDRNTHLYTSEEFIELFPGRVFEVLEVLTPNKKTISKKIQGNRINIIARNYPDSVKELKQKFKLNDGGDEYLVFCTLINLGPKALHCKLV